ncbi:tryptophan 7-halogenase [Phycisphaeraceae bacterium D3-23]
MQSKPVDRVVVLGGGSAGLMAAMTLKQKLPTLDVTVLRSPGIGIIGVGEGTALGFTRHLFEYLQIDPNAFYREAEPTWKLGIKFLWGKRDYFYYAFGPEYDRQLPGMPRPMGYYCGETDSLANVGPFSAFMDSDFAFMRHASGRPEMHNHLAFHFENKKLAAWLEQCCRKLKVGFMEATIQEVSVGEAGVEALHADDGRKIKADLYVDASGFRSELLGRALDVPFISYADALFCDRAVLGGWARTDEPVHPYTTSETMEAGWCWQIDHERIINRGYVYSSAFISDEDAEAEFRKANPKVEGPSRIVKFRSGRYAETWVKNVVGVGNASGFVEPLEATALQVIAMTSQGVASMLAEGGGRVTQSLRRQLNRFNARNWDSIRDFLALHYKFNDRLDNPFWRHCRAETPLGDAAEFAEIYQDNGPVVTAMGAAIPNDDQFGTAGYLTMFVGMDVPYTNPHHASAGERQAWQQANEHYKALARNGVPVTEALDYIRKNGVPA